MPYGLDFRPPKQNRPPPKGRPVPSCMTRPPKRARESRAGRCRVSPSPRRQAGVVPQSIPAAPHPGEATTWAAFAERFCRTERDRPPSPPMFNQPHTSALRISSASWLGRQAVLPRLGGLCLMGLGPVRRQGLCSTPCGPSPCPKPGPIRSPCVSNCRDSQGIARASGRQEHAVRRRGLCHVG